MTRTFVRFAIVVALLAIAADTGAAEKGKGGKAVLTPADDLKWSDMQGFPEVKLAVVQGDAKKGAHHSLIKLPANFAAPLHHHTSDHYVSVLSGTLVLVVDGKDNKLPPGSYFAFTGKKQHETRCEAGADCVLFLDVRGKWDVLPEKAAAGEKK